MAVQPDDLPYDDVAYPGHPFVQTHPDRLASLGRLYGVPTPMPSGSRVLELGCGDGGNLLPMACALPGAQFVGIDISARAIAIASTRAQAAGIDNARFEAQSLTDYAPPAGSFDYVIAHGVYSWVPEPVREALMALCAHALSEHGVAYVSYNTLPGGHLREVLRNILLAHVREGDSAAQQMQSARELLDVLRTAWAYDKDLATLVSLATRTRQDTDGLLYHDTLWPVNHRLYFDEFTTHAERHGLQFLAEANYWEMQVGWLPVSLREGVLATDDRMRRELLLDQLRMRTFRQTLLCRSGHELDDPPGPERLEQLAVSAHAQASAPDDDGRVTFTGANGANLTTDHDVVIAALQRVAAAWPAILPIADLWMADAEPEERRAICEALLRCYSAALAGVHVEPAAFGAAAVTKPRASAMARLQAQEGTIVANLRHESTTLDEPARLLVALLDGTRDRAALLEDLAVAMEGTVARADLAVWLERSLTQLERTALLLPT